MLNFENIGDRFTQIVHTKEWDELQEKYNNCEKKQHKRWNP